MVDTSKAFEVQIISPERIFYSGQVEMLEVKTTEGTIGILKNHIPLTAILAPGILRIHEAQQDASGETVVKEAALHDGFIEVLSNEVRVVAEICEWPDEIDINRANEAKIRAERRLMNTDSSSNPARAEMALRKSLVRLELAEREQSQS